MAECRICGKIDKSLPAIWKSWECMKCFRKMFTICYLPLSDISIKMITSDLQEKLKQANMSVVDMRMEKYVL